MKNYFGKNILLASSAILSVASVPAYAQSKIFDVAPQSVETAIGVVGKQGNIQVVGARKFTTGKRANGVHGEYPVDRALALLLDGTGLYAQQTAPQTYTVVPAQAVSLASPMDAHSQSDGPMAAGSAQDAPASDPVEVIVTAQRRSESSMKVAAALTAISGSNLKTLGVVNVADLQNVSPGLEISKGALGMNIAMRGIQTSDNTSKGEQDVSFNVDSVYMGRPAEQQLAFFDVDRVEVLRGPQGTLYGRSATAGAINIITNAPKLGDYSGYVDGEFGNYNTRRFEGAVNIPLGDKLALRIAGNANYRDGYAEWYDQTVTTTTGSYFISAAGLPAHNDENNAAGRVSLLYKPDDTLTARLTYTSAHLGGIGQTSVGYDNLVAAHFKSSGLILPADPVPAWVDQNFSVIGLDVTKRVGPVQFVVAASHQDFDMNDQVTSGQNPVVNNNGFKLIQQIEHFKTDAFEVRMSNSEPSLIDYTVGANYFKEEIDENYHEWLAPAATWSDQSTWAPQIEPNNTTTHNAWGVYGQGTWHVTERLGLVGGLRYTHDEVERVGTFGFGAFAGPCHYPDACTGNNVHPNNGYESDNKLTWRLGANFQIDPANLFYASVATGFKGGGFNDVDPAKGIAAGSQPYGPESLTAYEIGYKGRPLSNLTLTSSLFYNDFAEEQLAGSLNYSGQHITYTAVVPTRIYGWENEFTYRWGTKTTISGSASFMHSEYVDYLAGVNYGAQVQWAGESLDKTPDFVGSVAFDRNFDLSNGARVHFRFGTRYNSGYLLSAAGNTVHFNQKAFTRSDTSLSYSPPSDAFTLEVFVRNIEDKVQLTGGPDIYFGPNGTEANGYTPDTSAYPNGTPFNVSDPRMYGVRLKVKF